MKIAVFDVGGTYVKFAKGDEDGNLSHHGKVRTPQSKQAFHELVKDVINDLKEIEGLAFSMPGFIDSSKGYIVLGGSLRYHDQCHFIKEMQEDFPMPISIQNDAKCAALAEVYKGKAKDYQNAVMLVFGTGIGGAFIQEGNIYMGSHYMSSELSCVIAGDIAKQGYAATIGNQFSIPMLMDRIAKRLSLPHMEGEEAFQKLHEGNHEVRDELQKYYTNLAPHIFNFQCYYDPDIFFIGGGISVQPLFIDGICKAVEAFQSRIPLPLPKINITGATFHAEANLIGALYHFLKQEQLYG